MSDNDLYLIKGVLAFITILLLVFHMNDRLRHHLIESFGHALRYIALLGISVAVFYASAEQVATSVPFEPRHAGATGAIILVLLATVVSIREDRSRRR